MDQGDFIGRKISFKLGYMYALTGKQETKQLTIF
jgi:hypothetical protein